MTAVTPVCVLLDITQKRGRSCPADRSPNKRQRRCVARALRSPVPLRAGSAISSADEGDCAHRDGRPCHASVLRDTPADGEQLPCRDRPQHTRVSVGATPGTGDAPGMCRVPLAPREDGEVAGARVTSRAANSGAAGAAGWEPPAPSFAHTRSTATQQAVDGHSGATVAAALFRGAQQPLVRKNPIELGPFFPPTPAASESSDEAVQRASGGGGGEHSGTRGAGASVPLDSPAPADAASGKASGSSATMQRTSAKEEEDVCGAARGTDSDEPLPPVAALDAPGECSAADTSSASEQIEYVLDEQDAVCDQRLFDTIDLSRGCSARGLLSAEAAIPWWFAAAPPQHVLS